MIRDTLLVIDDSPLDLAILNEIFKGIFRVECAADARRGLSFLHHNHQRVCGVLLDICLERRGAGFTALHQLQTEENTAGLPVILITTDAIEKDVRASVERGAVDFLVKPVDPHTVQERVCGVVRRAWPAGSTVLDAPAEPVQQPQEENEGGSLFAPDLTLAQTRRLWAGWMDKLTAFCALRPGLDGAACRQLGQLTTLLANHWAKEHGDITAQEAELIGMAAALCDIGLLALPDRVAEAGEDQQGPDAQCYYQHTQLGQALFAGEGEELPLFRYAGQIACWHHKNADGSGWPVDAGADQMPLCAQLTRAALRVQRYLHHYQGYADRRERLLRALKSEAGTVIAPAVYRMIQQGGDELAAALDALGT